MYDHMYTINIKNINIYCNMFLCTKFSMNHHFFWYIFLFKSLMSHKFHLGPSSWSRPVTVAPRLFYVDPPQTPQSSLAPAWCWWWWWSWESIGKAWHGNNKKGILFFWSGSMIFCSGKDRYLSYVCINMQLSSNQTSFIFEAWQKWWSEAFLQWFPCHLGKL